MVVVCRNLLLLRQVKFVALIVNEQYFALPNLIDLSADNLSDAILVLVIQLVMFQLQNLRSQCLAEVQNGTTAKLLEVNFF